MNAPNEKDDQLLRTMCANGPEGPDPADPEFSKAFAALQKVEALFDLLRLPATAVEARTCDDLGPDRVLGEFAILRPLASGGMGQVYLARQESLRRLVALKVCKPEIARDPRMKSRFLAEGLALAQLAHPNVVPVLSTGEDQGYLFLAMEYVAGPTLAQILQAICSAPSDALASAVVTRVLACPDGENQSQPWGDGHARLDRAYQTWAVQTLQQVAQGLAAAHAAGILHREIKPANIVFAANGVPKIVDFGLARIAKAPSATVAGEFYGTPAYTSPEQARGDAEAVSPASDVFSFGVTLFECLSLDRPFRGRTSADVLSAVLNSDAPLLRRAEKRIPWELEAITDKCLRKKPAERYPTALALAEDLQNYLELRPVSAKSTSTFGRVGRLIRRRPWAAAFLLALFSATALGAFVAKHAWAQHQAEQRRAFAHNIDRGDVSLFRCLTGQRPTWLTKVIEQHRKQGIDAYTSALQYDPNAIRPLVQRARLYAANKETLDLALADLDKAKQVAPEYASVRKLRGYVLDELKRKDEGQVAKEEAKAIYPTVADDMYWLGVIARANEHDGVACYDFFTRALLLNPGDYWSRVERALCSISNEIDILRRVLPELSVAKTIRPDLPFACELLARFYSSDRSPKGEIDTTREKREMLELIERFGLDVLRGHDMSRVLQNEGNYEQAESMLLNVLDQDNGGETALKMGDLRLRLGDFASARDWYCRGIDEGCNYPVAFSSLTNALIALEDWKAVEKAFRDGIAVNPRRPFLYWNLAHWYETQGRLTEAEATYRSGCELPCESDDLAVPPPASDVVSCYRNLASFLSRQGRMNDCIQVLEEGIARIKPELASVKDLKEGRVLAARRHESIDLNC